MNTLVLPFVRLCALLWPLLAMGMLHAQGDGSLTSEFPKLSAKERSRIAAKESEDAAADQAYQQEMQVAEKAFQENRYEDALASYERARNLRPYNVYPKVKIQDLKALLKRKAEEEGTEAAVPASLPQEQPSEPVAAPIPPPLPPVAPPPTPPAPAVEAPVIKPAAMAKPPIPAKPEAPPATIPKRTPTVSEPRKPAPSGVEERRYQEGGAFVIERTVDDEGQRIVYKRVLHTWGHVFYFRDGLSVDERIWKERFNER